MVGNHYLLDLIIYLYWYKTHKTRPTQYSIIVNPEHKKNKKTGISERAHPPSILPSHRPSLTPHGFRAKQVNRHAMAREIVHPDRRIKEIARMVKEMGFPEPRKLATGLQGDAASPVSSTQVYLMLMQLLLPYPELNVQKLCNTGRGRCSTGGH